MAHIVSDNVRETSTTTGTGSFALGGALTTGRTFDSEMADGDTCHYAIHHTTLNQWEIGLGTYETTGNLLLRTTPLESSNAGAAVNFSAGDKTVELVLPALFVQTLYTLRGLTGVVRVDSGVPSADTDITDIVAAASDTVAGKIEIATDAEVEAGTDTTRAVTPGRQHQHPSAAKFWVKATANSTTMIVSYNMTSWADTATGDADGTIATDFGSANWVGVVTTQDNADGWDNEQCQSAGFNAQAAGTFGVLTSTITDGATAVTSLTDPVAWHVVGFGTQ